MNGPASEEPAPRSDGPEAPASAEAQPSPEAQRSPEAPPPPDTTAAGPETAATFPQGPAAPGTGAAGPGAPLSYGAPPGTAAGPADPALVTPPPPPVPGRNIASIAFGAAAIAILAGVLVFAFIKHQNSTAGVRVILPAPAAAGGLNQDYADERGSQFQSAVSALGQSFRVTTHGGKFGAAIYTSAPAGSSAQGASVALVYIGINAPSTAGQADPASAVKSLLSGISSRLTDARLVPEGGGRGDTRYACETGNSTSGSIAICAWGTDRTVGLLIPQVPVNLEPLAALMKKMEPDLVRG